MIPEAHERLADSDEPGFVDNSAHVSELLWKTAKGSFAPGQVDPAAVQAVINKVESKMVSTDAATQVVLRFNFMAGPESKVRLPKNTSAASTVVGHICSSLHKACRDTIVTTCRLPCCL